MESSTRAAPAGWVLENPGPQGDDVLDLFGYSGGEVMGVGREGTVVQFDGSSWTVTSVADIDLLGVWGTAPNNAYAVGEDGWILRFDGASWVPLQRVTTRRLLAIWGLSDSEIYVVGES